MRFKSRFVTLAGDARSFYFIVPFVARSGSQISPKLVFVFRLRAFFIVQILRDPTAFWPAYQEKWAGLLCNQTDGLQNWVDEMLGALSGGASEVTDIAEARAALDNLSGRLKRVESIKAGHDASVEEAVVAYFVSYGAALLSAPREIDAAGAVARYGEVRGVLEQFKSLISVLELSPSVVLGLADRDSQIIARALALRLKVRYDGLGHDALNQSEAVIVAADSRSLTASALMRIFPEQILFAFNLHPQGAGIAPDVAGLSRLDLVLPWHLEAEETDEDADETPLREASSVAAQIAATRAVSDPSWPARLEFYRVRNTLLAAGNPRFSRLPMLP